MKMLITFKKHFPTQEYRKKLVEITDEINKLIETKYSDIVDKVDVF